MAKRIFILSFYLCFMVVVSSACSIRITGTVLDAISQKPLSNATISIKGKTEITGKTDSLGNFSLNKICAGKQHLHIEHAACRLKHVEFTVEKDTTIIFYLEHNEHLLHEIEIKTTAIKKNVLQKNIDETILFKNAGADLGITLKELSGVSLIQTGSTINKPVVNGFHSERLAIEQDGVLLQNQSWGMEHAPEIDVQRAAQIQLIKGAQVLTKTSSAFGGFIKLKPAYELVSSGFHGAVQTGFFTNNNRYFVGGNLSYKSKKRGLGLYAQGMYDRAGNTQTASYFISNSGTKLYSYNAAVTYEHKKIQAVAYFNEYKNILGIYSGSQVGNITDLVRAINSPEPLVKSGFTYTIDKPFQAVRHYTIGAKTAYHFSSTTQFNLLYNFQKNTRNEFDFIRGNSDKPAASLIQNTHSVQLSLNSQIQKLKYEIGITGFYKNFDYGGAYFIPVNNTLQSATYIYIKYPFEKAVLEASLRLENAQRTIQNIKNDSAYIFQNYNGYSAAISWSKSLNTFSDIKIHAVKSWRVPSIIEQYSAGLHHGAASYEVGDKTISPEKSLGINTEILAHKNDKLFLSIEPHATFFQNYIYVAPTGTFTTTVRGTFPVFNYAQDKAWIYGINANIYYAPKEYFSLQTKATLVRGNNVKNNTDLPFMPQDAISLTTNFHLPNGKTIHKNTLYVEGDYFFKQKQVHGILDFAPAPNDYYIINTGVSTSVHAKEKEVSIAFSVNNILNNTYRNYLDRFRYFVHGKGRDVMLKVKYQF